MDQLSALQQWIARVGRLVDRAIAGELHVTAIPPLGKQPFAYGDLVPLGFALFGLRTAARRLRLESLDELLGRIETYLFERRSRGLWAFQSSGLETSIDSALVLLGIDDPEIVKELERFSDGQGGYIPQLHTDGIEAGKMTMRDSLLHWGSADYSIASLVRSLRRKVGLPPVTPISLLQEGFATRGGLYLANPYFPDWFLAMAIQDDPSAQILRTRLHDEVLSSAAADGSFGSFDRLLSTALGVLTLQNTAGAVPHSHIHALIRLLDEGVMMEPIPFYSSEQITWSKSDPWLLVYLGTTGGTQQLIRVSGQEHAITFYRDTGGIVTYSLALAALATACGSRDGTLISDCHPRYRCDQVQYIAAHALPPYVAAEVGV